jgi:hypothetical protein
MAANEPFVDSCAGQLRQVCIEVDGRNALCRAPPLRPVQPAGVAR